MLWTKVARDKLSELIRRDDFVRMHAISGDFAFIEFKDNHGCELTSFGKVEWMDSSRWIRDE